MSCSYIGYNPSFVVDTTNQTSDQVFAIDPDLEYYTLKFSPVSDNLILVFINGEFYLPTVDYYVVGNKLFFVKPNIPTTGYVYVFFLGTNYFRLNTVSDSSIEPEHLSSDLKLFEYDVFVGDGQTVDYTLYFTPGSPTSILIFIDGVIKHPYRDYIIIDNLLTFVDAPPEFSEIYCRNLGFKASEMIPEVPDLSIISDKLGDEAVITRTIQDEAVTNDKIETGTITVERFNNSVFENLINYEWVYESIVIESQFSRRLLVDTSTQSINIILPATPLLGQYIEIIDFNRNFDSFNCTAVRNGKTIGGQDANYTFNLANTHCRLVYGTNDNWEIFWNNTGAVFTGQLYTQNCEIASDEHGANTTFFSDTGLEAEIKTATEYSQDAYSATMGFGETDSYLQTGIEESRDSGYVYSYSHSVNGTDFVTEQEMIITLTFATGVVSVSGSGVKPYLTILLSDTITEIHPVLNTSTSTTTVLNFTYTVPRDNIALYMDITGFDPGDYTVTIDGVNFDIAAPIRLNVSLTENILKDLKQLMYISAIALGCMI